MSQIKTPRFRVSEWLIKLLYTRSLKEKPCSHLHLIEVVEPATHQCDACLAQGDTWPNLRMCLVCGYVGCCDTSKNKHMRQHIQTSGHPLIRSIEPGEGWIWCYEDNAFLSADSPQLDRPMPR